MANHITPQLPQTNGNIFTETTDGLVTYEQDGVFIHSDKDDDSSFPGKLKIIDKRDYSCIEWKSSLGNEYAPNCGESDWALVNSTAVGFKSDKCNKTDRVEILVPYAKRPISFEIYDLASFRYISIDTDPDCGWNRLTLIQKDGTTHPTLHFHAGGDDNFINMLKSYVSIKASTKEPGLFLTSSKNEAALEKSLSELQMFSENGSRHTAVQNYFNRPYETALGRFSKVTGFVDFLVHGHTANRPADELAEILHSSLGSEIIDSTHQDETGFEVVSCRTLGPRPIALREDSLRNEEWKEALDSEGRIKNPDQLTQRIFKGGVNPSLRCDVWKFLLGYYSYNSTTKERQELRKQKVDDYFRMKLQWKTISADQERRFSDLRDRKSLIDKDVLRTDRAHPFFGGQDNSNVHLLNDILMTYCMYNFDLGYVQGMSDLLSPILVIMENEVDAFWCFVGFMDRVWHNFEMDQHGIKMQLQNLKSLLHYVEPQLYEYLEKHESGNLYFCFRWLLIWFKREFRFNEIMRLWEVLFTDKPCKNFHLLFSVAILETEKHMLMENGFGFTEILKHINDKSQDINLDENLCKADAIYQQLVADSYMPQQVQDILGITAPPPICTNQAVVDRAANGAKTEHEVLRKTPCAAGDVMDHVVSARNADSPQSQLSGSFDTSSIEVLSESEMEARYQQAIGLQYL